MKNIKHYYLCYHQKLQTPREKSNKRHLSSQDWKKNTLLKEIKDLNKWRDTSCLWIGRINIVRMLVLPGMTYGFNVVTFISPRNLSCRNWQVDSKIYMIMQRS